MNAFLNVTWGLLNPDMFASVADTIEDVMQASVPGVIENVRVAEIDQGNNPIRILSIRSLPDEHTENLKHNVREENKKTKDPQEASLGRFGSLGSVIGAAQDLPDQNTAGRRPRGSAY